MNERLDRYFDSLFKDIPNTNEVRELRQEIYQNTLDKYTDLISQGKSEDASFNQAVSGIGDIEELFGKSFQIGNGSVYENTVPTDVLAGKLYSGEEISLNKTVCIGMAILALATYILGFFALGMYYGSGIMMALIAFAIGCSVFAWKYRIKKDLCEETFKRLQFENGSGYTKRMFERRRFMSTFMFSLSVMLYILVPAPIGVVYYHAAGALFFSFLILACAVCATFFYKKIRLIYVKTGSVKDYGKYFAKFGVIYDWFIRAVSFVRRNLKLSIYIVLNAIVFIMTIFFYAVISCDTDAWGWTWLIFVMAIILNRIIKNALDLIFLEKGEK